jgi:uncharacterized protein YxjI
MLPIFTAKNEFLVSQTREIAEYFGFETRNKYKVLDGEHQVMYVAEQQKGILGFLFRQWFGHWRPYDLHFFDENRTQVMTAEHPFGFFFQKLFVYDSGGDLIGSLHQRFSLFRRSFDVQNAQGKVIMEVRTGVVFFTKWNFPFMRGGLEVANVTKKFSGLFTELITDRDNFAVKFNGQLSLPERSLVVAAAVFIDLLYFEVKG